MTNQVESSVWTSVYQLEITDPVTGGLGGIANLPLLQLTQRTKYLFDQVTSVLASLGNFAPINSPSFTGTPLAPTPPSSASGLEMATAQYVRTQNSGPVGIDVSGGNRVLSTVEAGFGIVNVSGNPAADPYVLVPNQPGKWSFVNNVGRRILVRCAAGGNAVAIQSGRTQTLWSDGTNCLPFITDFDSIQITGRPSVPSAADYDSTGLIANTYFVQRALALTLPAYAPLVSPAFQGIPTTPTVSYSDNGTAVANTFWTRLLLSGVCTVDVTGGDTALTSAQASYGCLYFAGAPAGDLTVLFPAQPGRWSIYNNTSRRIYMRTAGGQRTSVVIPGNATTVWSEGNQILAFSDTFESINLTGKPTAPSGPDNDISNQVANTYFVQRALALNLPFYAPKASPSFTGAPQTTTAPDNDNGTQIANTYFVQRALALNLPNYAPINTPNFQGTPRAPTPPMSAGGTEMVNAQFVRNLVNWPLGIDVSAGNRVLSSVEGSYGIINCSGNPANDLYVLLPPQPAKTSFYNNTQRRIYVRLAAGGASVLVQSGRTVSIWCDGANCFPALTDFDSISITGNPTAPTPAFSARGQEIATAAYARTLYCGAVGIDVTNGDVALDANTASNGILNAGGTPNGTRNIILPAGSGKWSVINTTAQRVWVRLASGGSAVSVYPGRSKNIWTDGANVIADLTDFDNIGLTGAPTTPTPPLGDFGTAIANTAFVGQAISNAITSGLNGSAAGYQKFPSGIIAQWGSAGTATGYLDFITLPIAFPNRMLAGVATEANAEGWGAPLNAVTVYGVSGGRNSGEFRISGAKVPGGGAAGQTPFYVGGITFNYICWGF